MARMTKTEAKFRRARRAKADKLTSQLVENARRDARNERILDNIREIAEENEEQLTLLGSPPECVEAIIGVKVTEPMAVVYDRQKYIAGLMAANDWSEEDAEEWFSYNTMRGLEYMADPHKPIIVDTGCTKV